MRCIVLDLQHGRWEREALENAIAGVGGRAPTGAEVEWLEEENYFFRLSAWQERLLAWYDAIVAGVSALSVAGDPAATRGDDGPGRVPAAAVTAFSELTVSVHEALARGRKDSVRVAAASASTDAGRLAPAGN